MKHINYVEFLNQYLFLFPTKDLYIINRYTIFINSDLSRLFKFKYFGKILII